MLKNLFEELLKVTNDLELVGLKYKDSTGVYDLVFNEELWNIKSTTDLNDEDELCSSIDELMQVFIDCDRFMRPDDEYGVKLEDLHDGDYVYIRSAAMGAYGIFSHYDKNHVYFYITFDTDSCSNRIDYILNFNDIIHNDEEAWDIFLANETERVLIDKLLADRDFIFNKEIKKFNHI